MPGLDVDWLEAAHGAKTTTPRGKMCRRQALIEKWRIATLYADHQQMPSNPLVESFRPFLALCLYASAPAFGQVNHRECRACCSLSL